MPIAIYTMLTRNFLPFTEPLLHFEIQLIVLAKVCLPYCTGAPSYLAVMSPYISLPCLLT